MARPNLAGISFSQETDMNSTAIFVAVFVAILVAIVFPFILSGERWKAAQVRADARRLADAKMNARLLKFNL
jgi:hypothetical protein